MHRREFLSLAAGALAYGQRAVQDITVEAKPDWFRFGQTNAYLYAYNGRVPGPAIEARPGDTLRIRFINRLAEPTNLHFHGLHVSPSGNADNAFVMVDAGGEFLYEVPIPASHPAGLHWIHPHMHGSVADQVWRGLAMPLVVRGDLDAIPEIAAAAERILVLQDVTLDGGGVPVTPSVMERQMGREGNLITVSGERTPRIDIRRDGWVRLRWLNASCSRIYRIRIDGHALVQVASDGGALPAPRPIDELLLAPGQRADTMVFGSAARGRFAIRNLAFNRGTGASAPSVLATLTYAGIEPNPVALPAALIAAPKPAAPLRARTFTLGGSMGGGMMGGSGMSFTINGLDFNAERVDTRVALGDTEDWEFINPMGIDHPMHVHTNTFQVVNADGSLDAAQLDVVRVPALGRVRVRTRFSDFRGRLMYHCHILDHEDLGMMGVLEIA